MRSLGNRQVFLSASFPSGERAELVRPYDAAAVGDAVTAVIRAILVADGRLVFGGHPTITPLVLLIAREHKARAMVDVFQSEWFQDQVTPETYRLVEEGLGAIHWTVRGRTLEESLQIMRVEMFSSISPAGAVFIGGMSGIQDEYELFGTEFPGVPRLPLAGPGGQAARLPVDMSTAPVGLVEELSSRRYPYLASLIVRALADRTELDQGRSSNG